MWLTLTYNGQWTLTKTTLHLLSKVCSNSASLTKISWKCILLWLNSSPSSPSLCSATRRVLMTGSKKGWDRTPNSKFWQEWLVIVSKMFTPSHGSAAGPRSDHTMKNKVTNLVKQKQNNRYLTSLNKEGINFEKPSWRQNTILLFENASLIVMSITITFLLLILNQPKASKRASSRKSSDRKEVITVRVLNWAGSFTKESVAGGKAEAIDSPEIRRTKTLYH
jgi:hypothetical protein